MKRIPRSCKPDSVTLCKNEFLQGLSFIYLFDQWSNPRASGVRRTRNHRRAARLPISSCIGLGLPCPSDCSNGGGLLPHLFTLTSRKRRFVFCGTLCELAFKQAPPVFTRNPALWCPDFPLLCPKAWERTTASRKILGLWSIKNIGPFFFRGDFFLNDHLSM